MEARNGCDAEAGEEKPRLSIRQIRQAAQKESLAAQAAKAQQEPRHSRNPAPQKKKPSIFGGLFQVREPTQAALDQVAAQMIAQHGSTSATKVPNVRLEKMPEHVPKVNSKWDGIPESAKQKRERAEKKQAQATKHDPFFSIDPRSRSSDGKDTRKSNQGSRNSSATNSSFGSHPNSSGSQQASARTRFYAQSVNSSGDLASQRRTDYSVHSHSLTSASLGSLPKSLPERPSHPREDNSSSGLSGTSRYRDESEIHRPKTTATAKSHVSRMGSVRSQPTPTIESVPQHSASPLPSPHEASPTTPPPCETTSENQFAANATIGQRVSLVSSGPGVLGPPAVANKKSQTTVNHAFLAGEAQELVLSDAASTDYTADLPLQDGESARIIPSRSISSVPRVQQDVEKRPDSSRARLGLRASRLFRDDDTPWELREHHQPPHSLKVPVSSNPRTMSSPRMKHFHKPFGIFNKEKDKDSG